MIKSFQSGAMPPNNNTALKPGQIFAGNYRILGTIGQGGMGTVYEVLQTNLGKRRALKTLSTHSLADKQVLRFQAEARVLSRFDHQNIVKVYDVGVAESNLAYYVMDMLEGETLEARLKKAQLTLPESLDIFSQILSALAYAHKRGVVHRDIKPSNIMITKVDHNSRLIKLLDFGIARHLDEKGNSLAVTGSGEVVGSPHYMSPEQALGKRVDARSDLYSAGCVLYEMLTGHRLFDGENAMLTIDMHIKQNVDQLLEEAASGNEDLAELLKGCLEKDADDRFASAELADEALSLVQENDYTSEQGRTRKHRRRTRGSSSTTSTTTGGSNTSITQSLRHISRKMTLTFLVIAAGAVAVLAGVFTSTKSEREVKPAETINKTGAAPRPDLWLDRFAADKENLLNRIIWNGKKTLVYHFPPEGSVGSLSWGGNWAAAQGDVTIRDIGIPITFKPAVNCVDKPSTLRRIGDGDFGVISFSGFDSVDEDVLRHLDHLQGLTGLLLNGTAVGAKLPEVLKSMPELRLLDLSECKLEEETIVKTIQEEKHLIVLKTPPMATSDKLLATLPHSELRELSLTLEKKSTKTAALLGEQQNLVALYVSGNCLQPADLHDLAKLKNLSRLAIGALGETKGLVEELSRLKHLKYLKVPQEYCDAETYNALHENLPHTVIQITSTKIVL